MNQVPLSAQQIESKFQQALALHQQGQIGRAQILYQEILKDQPRHFNSRHLLGVAALQSGRIDIALRLITEAIAIDPNVPAAYNNLGNAYLEIRRLHDALASFDKALSLSPDHVDALINRAFALKELGRLDEALESCDQVIALKPDHVQALNNRGNTLLELGRLEEAIASFDAALARHGHFAEAFNNKGNVLKKLGRPEEALTCFDQALSIRPDYFEAITNRGGVLYALDRLTEALAAYDRALAINPGIAEAHFKRATTLLLMQQHEEALASFDRALALNPEYSEALINRGTLLLQLRHPEQALSSFDRAVVLSPDDATAWSGWGQAHMELQQMAKALACFDKAIELEPKRAGLYINQADALRRANRLAEAVTSYEKALSLEPAYAYLPGDLLHVCSQLCDWTDLPARRTALLGAIRAGQKVCTPFAALGLFDDPEAHRIVATLNARDKHPRNDALGPCPPQPPHERIRIGYFSADFHNHATAYLMAELFETHDHDRFELFGFSFGPAVEDEMRQRVAAAFDRFLDVGRHSDREVAMLARELGIDIAIDLKGYTQDSRPDLFALRCAPLQVSYLGYPGTLGADYIDYLIADKVVIPVAEQPHYTEKVVYLPHSYQVNDSQRKIADKVFTRAELGLPETGIVFCCFNNSYKIQPETFDSWVRIVQAVEGSVLWLFESNRWVADNLRKEAVARGLDPARLVFAANLPLAEHLARYRAADLFLDAFPYNAHTTASDALWAGLPVLTRSGRSFASRVGASLLTAVGLPELITTTVEDYERTAIELAQDPAALAALKARLDRNRLTQPLFNGKLFAKHIETAYSTMYERCQAGLPPEGFEVAAA